MGGFFRFFLGGGLFVFFCGFFFFFFFEMPGCNVMFMFSLCAAYLPSERLLFGSVSFFLGGGKGFRGWGVFVWQ